MLYKVFYRVRGSRKLYFELVLADTAHDARASFFAFVVELNDDVDKYDVTDVQFVT